MGKNQEQIRQSFLKLLTQREVEQRTVSFPFDDVASTFEFQEGRLFCIDAMDSLEKVWSFVGMFHNKEELGKCVSICLRELPVEKGLKANDEITFTERPRQDGTRTSKRFKVEIKRKISFSKLLTQREVEQRTVLFPFDAVASVFEFQKGRLFCIDAMDSLEKMWSFIGMFHNNEEFGNCVSICLHQFSVEKGLKANDEITFTERPQQESMRTYKRFKVETKRKIRLFGQDIWGELMM
ncbi:hypothetical protein GQ457_16G001550 [Hibiscus cannabinus]